MEGEIVTFKIGNIILGTLKGRSTVTPLSLELENNSDANIDSDGTLNRVKLLMSLDSDNNPDNGIQIASTTRIEYFNKSINFSLPENEFESTLINELDIPLSDIPTKEESKAHFQKSLKDLPPEPPRKIIAIGADKALILSWENVEFATSYNVYISKSKKFLENPYKVHSPSFEIGNLKNNFLYYIKITSLNKSEEGALSQISKAVTSENIFSLSNTDSGFFKIQNLYSELDDSLKEIINLAYDSLDKPNIHILNEDKPDPNTLQTVFKNTLGFCQSANEVSCKNAYMDLCVGYGLGPYLDLCFEKYKKSFYPLVYKKAFPSDGPPLETCFNDNPSNPTYPCLHYIEGHFTAFLVEGLEYIIDGKTRFTYKGGGFQYKKGDKVTFKLRDIILGTVLAGKFITPLTLLKTVSPNIKFDDPKVINLFKFLLALDRNENPGDGIQIYLETKNKMVGKNFNFQSEYTDFDKTIKDLLETDQDDLGTEKNPILLDFLSPEKAAALLEMELVKLPPEPPSNIQILSKVQSLTINFSHAEFADHYIVYLSQNKNELGDSFNSNGKSFILHNLSSGKPYYIRIASKNDNGRGNLSKQFRVKLKK